MTPKGEFKLKDMDERQRAEFIRRFQQAKRFDRLDQKVVVHEIRPRFDWWMALQVAVLLAVITGLVVFLVMVGVL